MHTKMNSTSTTYSRPPWLRRSYGVLLVALPLAAVLVGSTQVAVAAAVAPSCYGASATHWGGPGNDEIHGSEGNDVIVGLAGSDRLFGEGGHDIICGDAGNDLLVGGVGDDKIAGEEGSDLLEGEAGNDLLRGFGGNDSLDGGFGNDTLDGGDAHDWARNWGNDALVGREGQDLLRGGAGDDRINAENDDNQSPDRLYGFAGNDSLYAHDGVRNDVMQGGGGTFDICVGDPGEAGTDCEVL